MNLPTDNWRKAAILVASLDAENMDAVCATLSAEEAEQLRHAVDALAAIDADEQQAIVTEFLSCGASRLAESAGGVELDDDLARRLATFERFPVPTETMAPHPPNTAQSALIGMNAGALYRCLAGEHLQTVAVVMAHLPATEAAAILRYWPADQQSEVLERVAGLTSTDRELWREIEQELLARLRSDAESAATARRSEATVAAILEAADEPVRLAWRDRCNIRQETNRASRSELPARFSRSLPSWSRAEIAPDAATNNSPLDEPSDDKCYGAASGGKAEGESAYSWDDLRQLDDESLATIFAAAPAECVRLALAGAETALIERLRRHLGPRAARSLDHQLQRLPTVRISDIAEAQRRLASLAQRLFRQDLASAAGGTRTAVDGQRRPGDSP